MKNLKKLISLLLIMSVLLQLKTGLADTTRTNCYTEAEVIKIQKLQVDFDAGKKKIKVMDEVNKILKEDNEKLKKQRAAIAISCFALGLLTMFGAVSAANKSK